MRQERPGPDPRRSLIALFGLAAAAGSCQSARAPEGEVETTSAAVTAASDPTQFEVASDWRVTQGNAQSLTITTTRTQGAGALAVKAPQGYTRINSKPPSSSNPKLAGIDLGAVVSLDLMLPAQQANRSGSSGPGRRLKL